MPVTNPFHERSGHFLANPTSAARLYIMLLFDPLARIIGYSAMYQRLLDSKSIWAELGFYPLIFGTLSVHSAESGLLFVNACTKLAFV